MPARPAAAAGTHPSAGPEDPAPARTPPARGSGSTPPAPKPWSQSFSQSYGSILPTSLTYVLVSTRGSSPWRPAAVISTTGRETRHAPGFSRTVEHTPDAGPQPALFPRPAPSLRITRFHGASIQNTRLSRKENSSWGTRQRLLACLRCRSYCILIPATES